MMDFGDSDNASTDSRPKKYHEGWVLHRSGRSTSNNSQNWAKLWMVLRGEYLYIFKNDRTNNDTKYSRLSQVIYWKPESWFLERREHLIGTLHLSEHTICQNIQSKSRGSYKLEVTTIGIEGDDKVNQFKFDKENERDVWKSFIIGISVGIVPTDVHLLPGQLKDVHVAIDEVRNVPPPVPSIPRPRIDPNSASIPYQRDEPWGNSGILGQDSDNNNHRKYSDHHSDDDRSSNSGSFRSHLTHRPPPQGNKMDPGGGGGVHNLRDLRSRQTEIAFKSLDTPRWGEQQPYRRAEYQDRSPPVERSRYLEETVSEDSGYSPNNSVNDGKPQQSVRLDHKHPTGEFKSPPKTHLFHRDPDRNRETPSWFFEHMPREEAESVLTCGRKFGNVLMRPSSTWATSQKYVISMRREVAGGTNLNHYEVIRSSEGFKINVDNPHAPMRCLSEVMDFFVNVAGPGTKPMRTNDLSKIYSSTMSERGSTTSHSVAPPAPAPPPPAPAFSTMDRMASNSFDFPTPTSPSAAPEANWSFGKPNLDAGSPSWSQPSPSAPQANQRLNVAGNVSSGIAQAVSEMNQDFGRHSGHDDPDSREYINVNRDGRQPQQEFSWAPAKPASQAVYSRSDSNDRWDTRNRGGQHQQYGRSDSYGSGRPTYYGTGPPPENGYRDQDLNQPVPAKHVPSGTLQKAENDISSHFDFLDINGVPARNYDRANDYGSRDAVPPPPNFLPPPVPAPPAGPPPPPAPPGGQGIPAPPPVNSQGFRTLQNPNSGAPPPPPPNAFNTTPNPNRQQNNPPPARAFGGGNTFEDELKGRLVGQREQIYASGAQVLKNW